MTAPRIGVVVVAAGSGSRFGAQVPKALVRLHGRTLLAWSVAAAQGCPGIAAVVVVAPVTHLDEARREVEAYAGTPVTVVAGGAERPDSVAAGLAALPERVDTVLVHDAARALAPSSLFADVAAAVTDEHPAVVPGLPVVDTIKQVDAAGIVVATVPRVSLRAVQTPQGFRRDVLERAHTQASAAVTDDAELVESMGLSVLVVPGDLRAHKITTPEDLERVAAMASLPADEEART